MIERRGRPESRFGLLGVLGLCAAFACADASDTAPVAADEFEGEAAAHIAPARFAEQIQLPPTTGTIDLGQRDARGAVVGVVCETCHSAGVRSAIASRGASADEVHGEIRLEHGAGRISCASCHDPKDPTRLRLADGTSLALQEVITLCGQCHGSQLRDFEHGAHGGARGYWDLSRGERIRNSCTACHAPHAPDYPLVAPAPAPNDRLLPRTGSGGHS